MLIDFANEDVLDLALDSASKSGGSVLRNDGKLLSESESEISITLGYFFRACAVHIGKSHCIECLVYRSCTVYQYNRLVGPHGVGP